MSTAVSEVIDLVIDNLRRECDDVDKKVADVVFTKLDFLKDSIEASKNLPNQLVRNGFLSQRRDI